MAIIQIIVILIVILLIVNISLAFRAGTKETANKLNEIKNSIAYLEQNLKDTEIDLKSEFTTNRKENSDNSKSLREEVNNQLNAFAKIFSEQLTKLTSSVENKFTAFQSSIETNNKDNRKELRENLETFKTSLNEGLKNFNENRFHSHC